MTRGDAAAEWESPVITRMEEDEPIAVQMGPLIDCVFLLLIFFLLVALTKPKHSELQFVHAHAAVTAEAAKKPERLVIHINRRGQARLADTRLAPGEFADALMKRAAENADVLVRLIPDKELMMEQIMPVVDACKNAGLNRIEIRSEIDR